MEPAPKDGAESRPPAGAGEPRYAGFWIRVVAHLVDATLLAFIVGTITVTFLVFYLLAYLAGRQEERRARENADAEEQPDDAPLPSP